MIPDGRGGGNAGLYHHHHHLLLLLLRCDPTNSVTLFYNETLMTSYTIIQGDNDEHQEAIQRGRDSGGTAEGMGAVEHHSPPGALAAV